MMHKIKMGMLHAIKPSHPIFTDR